MATTMYVHSFTLNPKLGLPVFGCSFCRSWVDTGGCRSCCPFWLYEKTDVLDTLTAVFIWEPEYEIGRENEIASAAICIF